MPNGSNPRREHLWDWRNEVDAILRDERKYRTRTQNEHEGDHGGGNRNRRRHRSNGVPALAGVNRDVLEAPERAEAHLSKKIEAHHRDHRGPGGERMER
jgi:hypothetical protein